MALSKARLEALRTRAREVFRRLASTYPDACCSLDHRKPLELLVATILAAQCTDARVNQVTPGLFRRYKTPQDFVDAPPGELEEVIRSCGFYNQKAKSIRNACARIIEEYGGHVPDTMEALLTLDGVGRKTANVLLGECFGVPGVIVDTHCTRVNNRLGFTAHDDPTKIEQDLMQVWPRDHWTEWSHLTVFHGRQICRARAPLCIECPVQELCPFVQRGKGPRGKNPG